MIFPDIFSNIFLVGLCLHLIQAYSTVGGPKMGKLVGRGYANVSNRLNTRKIACSPLSVFYDQLQLYE